MIRLESGLPLGIAANSEYAETTLSLAPGDGFTFLSDGVVEAQNTQFIGFDRPQAVSAQSAHEIAGAAQAFGQQDDINVLTLTIAGAEVLHA
ncbi:MAG TPA: SpoIIE family protein phosphatase [Silvibacterium sp.]|nr:SpoIIE family protein phosphatase [Silvibacterium sp.]